MRCVRVLMCFWSCIASHGGVVVSHYVVVRVVWVLVGEGRKVACCWLVDGVGAVS